MRYLITTAIWMWDVPEQRHRGWMYSAWVETHEVSETELAICVSGEMCAEIIGG